MFKKTLFAVLAGLMIASPAVASDKIAVFVISEAASNATERLTGLEVALPGPIFDHVVHQLSIVTEEATASTVIAWHPHYMFEVAEHLEVGVGPAITNHNSHGVDKVYTALGVSVDYAINDFRIGAELNQDLDAAAHPHVLSTFKLGYAF